MTYGWADQVLQPLQGVDYYEASVARNGPRTGEFFRLHAAHVVDNKPVRTRSLCPYPQVARYSGQGSIGEEVNFRCVVP